jgi:hypothetical protein
LFTTDSTTNRTLDIFPLKIFCSKKMEGSKWLSCHCGSCAQWLEGLGVFEPCSCCGAIASFERARILPELARFHPIAERVAETPYGALELEETKQLFASIAAFSEELATLLFGGQHSNLTASCRWYAMAHRHIKQEQHVGVTLRVVRKMRLDHCVYQEGLKHVCANPGLMRGFCELHRLKVRYANRKLHVLFPEALARLCMDYLGYSRKNLFVTSWYTGPRYMF